VAAALAQAGEAYGGVLLDGAPYAWVEVPREEVRRRAVDALARLAELRQATGDQEGAHSRWSRRRPPTRWPGSWTGG
jgi:hypothetical protein